MVGRSDILCRAFSPWFLNVAHTQAVGLGWYMAAPLALNKIGSRNDAVLLCGGEEGGTAVDADV